MHVARAPSTGGDLVIVRRAELAHGFFYAVWRTSAADREAKLEGLMDGAPQFKLVDVSSEGVPDVVVDRGEDPVADRFARRSRRGRETIEAPAYARHGAGRHGDAPSSCATGLDTGCPRWPVAESCRHAR